MASGGARPGAGRPSKLTAEFQSELVALLERGHDRDIAAQSLGVGASTLMAWLKLAESEEPGQAHYEFKNAVLRAMAKAQVGMVDKWLAGDPSAEWSYGPGKAAKEYLQLTQRRFAERVRVQVQDELDDLLTIVERVCSREDFARVLEAIAARDRGEEIAAAESADGTVGPSIQ